MSLGYVKGLIVFTCDGCDDTLETETDDFYQAREELRDNDWRAVKTRDDRWEHHCPDCRP